MIIKSDPEQFQNYLSDASNYHGFAESIYLPEHEQEVVQLFKTFNEQRIRVTISGNGTGVTGARVPEGGVVVSLEKLNQIIELNLSEKFIRVQPAIILKDLQDYVESNGLFYPPDPTERNCFIGATVATNASGARTFKYGATRNHVIGLRVVLPSGETVKIDRGNNFADGLKATLLTESSKMISFPLPSYKMPETKNAAGYFSKPNMDLIDLFIGAEGTLGVITEIKLQLIDLPQNIFSCVAFFTVETDALNFIDESQAKKNLSAVEKETGIINPCALEFFDFHSLNFLRTDFPNIPADSHSAVWFEQEFNDNEDETASAWIKLLNKHRCNEDMVWFAADKNEHEKFHQFRHAISWKVNEFISQQKLKKVGTDVAVPVKHFRQFYLWMKDSVEKENINYVVYGHFGNCHPHLNMLPRNETEYRIAKQIYGAICTEAVRLEGTISAEHGIGKLKRDYLLEMLGEENVQRMASLKLILDPNKILNIGNMFDEKYL